MHLLKPIMIVNHRIYNSDLSSIKMSVHINVVHFHVLTTEKIKQWLIIPYNLALKPEQELHFGFCSADIYLTPPSLSPSAFLHFVLSDTVFHSLISISSFIEAGKNKPICQEHCVYLCLSKQCHTVVSLAQTICLKIFICFFLVLFLAVCNLNPTHCCLPLSNKAMHACVCVLRVRTGGSFS